MVSTLEFHEGNGAGATLGSVANLNMGTTDAKGLVAATYPITAGSNSYEKWFVGSWFGTFTKINNVQFWQSAGSLGTGEVVMWGSTITYATPALTASSIAVGSIPTADPGTANVLVGSSLAGSLVTAGRGDWIVVQYKTTTGASPGPTNQKTLTLQWDEQ